MASQMDKTPREKKEETRPQQTKGQMIRGHQGNTGSEQDRASAREERGSPFMVKFNFSLLQQLKLNYSFLDCCEELKIRKSLE